MHPESGENDWKKFVPMHEEFDNRTAEASFGAENKTHEDYRETTKKYKNFTPQYSDLYKVRLKQLEDALKESNPSDLKCIALSKMKEGEACYVIGCIFKVMKNRKSYVKAIEEGETLKELIEFDSIVPDEADEVYLENSTGKRMLNLDGAKIVLDANGKSLKACAANIISGMVVRLRCSLVSQNEIQVYEIQMPGIIPFQNVMNAELPENDSPGIGLLMEQLSQGKQPNLVALISGLEIHGEDPTEEDALGLLRDCLTGQWGSEVIASLLKCLEALLFLGNYIRFDNKVNKQLLRSYEYKDKHSLILEQIGSSMKKADELISSLASKYNVLLMPGETDVTDSFLPQRALPTFCFPRTTNCTKVTMLSNPSSVTIKDKVLTLSDGMNVAKILQMTPGLQNEVDILEMTLKGRHFAPNCPEGHPCFPSKIRDDLIIEKPTNFFICGGARSHQTRLLQSRTHTVKLLTVPKFSTTKSIVLLDLDSHRSYQLSFDNKLNK